MIKKFRVSGFKSLLDTEAQFEPFNVFVGPNGVGKSSMLQAIGFLKGFVSSSIESYLKDRPYSYDDLPSLNKRNRKISWNVEFALTNPVTGNPTKYEYYAEIGKKRYPYVAWERLRSFSGESSNTLFIRQGKRCFVFNQSTMEHEDLPASRLPASALSLLEDKEHYPECMLIKDFLYGIKSYLLWDSKELRIPSQLKDADLGSEGQNLASFLHSLKRKHPKKFKMLVRTIRAFVPSIRDIRIIGSGWGWKSIELVEAGAKQNIVYNNRQVSDGILRMLAIASLRFNPAPPSVITLEEPENGVHPQLLGKLIDLLKSLPSMNPPTQVFIASHSPYVLDHFVDNPGAIQIMESAGRSKGSNLIKLSDKKSLGLARKTLSKSLGELWFSGVLGGSANGNNR